MSVARLIRPFIPRRWQVPARYYQHRAAGILEREVSLLTRAVDSGECVVDVGANFGVLSYAFLRRGAVVHAFEPQPACLDVLRAYARHQPNLRVYDVAVGASAARGVLTIPVEAAFAGSPSATLRRAEHAAATMDVAVATLDSLMSGHDVALIKIDVEGAELDVLRGARATIRQCRPLMMIEVEQRHHDDGLEGVVKEIEALCYRAAYLDAGRRVVAVQWTVDEVKRLNAAGVNNFLFAPIDGTRHWPR